MEAGILFTDVDGTLAHYKEDVLLHGTLRASEPGGPEDVFHPEARTRQRRAARSRPHALRAPAALRARRRWRTQDEGHLSRLYALPISTSGRTAYISRGTIQLCRTLRRQGQRLVLISGMRVRAAARACVRPIRPPPHVQPCNPARMTQQRGLRAPRLRARALWRCAVTRVR